MAPPADELVSLAAFVVIAAAALVTVLIATHVLSRLRTDSDDWALRGSRLVGTLARVSLAIPARGVGAVVCLASRAGVRMPARSDDALPVPAGEEVVIVDLSGGVAVVQALPH